MRGVAVILVVLFHASWISGGFVGVDVFFVISGYLIGGQLLRELCTTGRIDIVAFSSRRVRRLLPALAMTTTLTVFFALLIVDADLPLQATIRTAIAASLIGANFSLYRQSGDYFSPSAEENPLLHTWSLSLEEQFYIFTPLVFLFWALFATKTKAKHLVLWTLLAIGGLSFGKSVWLVDFSTASDHLHTAQQLAFYSPTTRAWQFIIGILFAVPFPPKIAAARQAPVSISIAVHRVSVLAGLGLLSIASLGYNQETSFPGAAAVAPSVAALLLLMSLRHVRLASFFLANRGLQRVGDWSYSVYLIHWPAIVFADALWPEQRAASTLAALLSLPLAAASWRWIENRWRTPGLMRHSTLLLAAICILLPITAALAASEVRRLAMDSVLKCPASVCYTPSLSTKASSEARTRRIVLAGDSHAERLGVVLPTLTATLGISVAEFTQPGCPFLVGTSGRPYRGCPDWQTATLERILDEAPDLVLVHGYTTGRVTTLNSGRLGPLHLYSEDGVRARDTDEALMLYHEGLERLAETLVRNGIPLLIISTVPDFDDLPMSRVSALGLLLGHRPLASTPRERADSVSRNAEVLRVEREVATRFHGGVTVIDPLPYICTDFCAQARDGRLLYTDEDHLSEEGAWLVLHGALPAIRRILSSDEPNL